MSVRLKIEDSREGLVATISQRDDTGQGDRPTLSLSSRKQGRGKTAGENAGAVARVETLRHRRHKTGTSAEPRPWLVAGVGKSL